MGEFHVPVLLEESVSLLGVAPGKRFIDCTLGGGGHTSEIISRGGIVLGIDQDFEAIEHVQSTSKLAASEGKLILRHGNFSDLEKIAEAVGFERVDGILFDLGVSTHQLEAEHRGFSFNQESELDMRKDPLSQQVTAADLIAVASEKELARIIWEFGEEREARKIAREIVKVREKDPIKTTKQLAEIILRVRKRTGRDRNHPATRTFQALRIAVNDELETLGLALAQALNLLEHRGRLVVISFHSLEDRIVKNFLRANQLENRLRILTERPVGPTEPEVRKNPRSRSGKLRAAEKI